MRVVDKPDAVVAYPWRDIADLVWDGMTVPAAAKELGLTWREIDLAMSEDVRGFLLDVSMVAGYRDSALKEEMCNASNTTNNRV